MVPGKNAKKNPKPEAKKSPKTILHPFLLTGLTLWIHQLRINDPHEQPSGDMWGYQLSRCDVECRQCLPVWCCFHGFRRSDVLKLLGFGKKGDVKTGGFLKLGRLTPKTHWPWACLGKQIWATCFGVLRYGFLTFFWELLELVRTLLWQSIGGK